MVANSLPIPAAVVGDLVDYQGSLGHYRDIVFKVIRVADCGRLTLAYPEYLDTWVIRRVRPTSVRVVLSAERPIQGDQLAMFEPAEREPALF